jgi:hypothetical protein
MKKGQITIFIIISIVLLLFVIILLPRINDDVDVIETDGARQVRVFVESCLREESLAHIGLFGVQGGMPYMAELNNSIIMPYYFMNENTMPTFEEYEENLARGLFFAQDYCFKEASKKFDISTEYNYPEVMILDEGVKLKFSLPISLEEDGNTYDVYDLYNYDIDIRLKYIYEVAEQLVMKKVQNPEMLDIMFMARFDVDVIYTPIDEHQARYTLTDLKSPLYGEPYIFMFLTITQNQTITDNIVPEIIIAQNISAKVGEYVEGQIFAKDADGDNLTFYAYHPLINIEEDGRFRYTPEQIGPQTVRYFVHDGKEAAAGIFTIEVTE